MGVGNSRICTAPRADSNCQRPSPPHQIRPPHEQAEKQTHGGVGGLTHHVLFPRIHLNCHQTPRVVNTLSHPIRLPAKHHGSTLAPLSAARIQTQLGWRWNSRSAPRIRATCHQTHTAASAHSRGPSQRTQIKRMEPLLELLELLEGTHMLLHGARSTCHHTNTFGSQYFVPLVVSTSGVQGAQNLLSTFQPITHWRICGTIHYIRRFTRA